MALVLIATKGWPLAPASRIVMDVSIGAAVYGLAVAALFPSLLSGFKRRRNRPGCL